MIFLFFTSSLGPLEPELGPFKDWQEIGDIWEISLKVASAPESWCPGCTASPWGRFPKYQMSPNFMLQQCVITWYSQNWCKKNNGNCLLLYTHILPGTVFCHVVIGNMGSNALGDLTVQAVTHYGYDTGYSGGTQLSLPKLFPPSCVFAVAVGGGLKCLYLRFC